MIDSLTGSPSDQLPDVLATGQTDVNQIFVSLAARESSGRDADYLQWHSLDHRPEQFRLKGIRHSLRLVSTPACRAARLYTSEHFDAVDHVMTYFFAAEAEPDHFKALSQALGGERRPFRLPSVAAGYFDLSGKAAAPRAVAGADVIPWRPALGVFLLIEEAASTPVELIDVDGVAGVWWHRNTEGLSLSYCYLDDDPLAVTEKLKAPLQRRWEKGESRPLLAAPFYVPVAFEWARYLP